MSWSMVDLNGQTAYTTVPCRFPPIRHFQRIADEPDRDLLDAVEAMTDDQARDAIGQIELVPANERFSGAHAVPVMNAFTGFDPAGSPFSDGSYGVLYLQMQRDAAISKRKCDATAFLAATAQAPIKLQFSLYAIGLAGSAADLRQAEGMRPTGRSDASITGSRRIGAQLRAAGIAGALYSDTRNSDADSLAVLRPGMLSDYVRHAHIELSWDGKAIDSVYVLPAATDTIQP